MSAEPQERGARERVQAAWERTLSVVASLPFASPQSAFEAGYLAALRDAAPSGPERKWKSPDGLICATCGNGHFAHDEGRCPAAERTRESDWAEPTDAEVAHYAEISERRTQGETELLEDQFDRETTERLCYVCRALWLEIDTLRSQVAQPSGEELSSGRAQVKDADMRPPRFESGRVSLTGGPLISEKRGPSPLGTNPTKIPPAGKIFELLDRWTAEQRAEVFYHLEHHWCWHCGHPQADDVHGDCAPRAPTREQVEALQRWADDYTMEQCEAGEWLLRADVLSLFAAPTERSE